MADLLDDVTCTEHVGGIVYIASGTKRSPPRWHPPRSGAESRRRTVSVVPPVAPWTSEARRLAVRPFVWQPPGI